MSEIEIGEYVRTKNGLIGKVNEIEPKGSGTRFAGEYLSDTIIQFNDGKVYERRVKDNYIVNHSKNIIDLIEVGDIVNEQRVLCLKKDNDDCINDIGTSCIGIGDINIYIGYNEANIKTILTHEQYERNCYTVKEEE